MNAQDKPVSDRTVWLVLLAVAVVLLAIGGVVGRLLPTAVDEGDCVSSPRATVQVTDQGLVCQFDLSSR